MTGWRSHLRHTDGRIARCSRLKISSLFLPPSSSPPNRHPLHVGGWRAQGGQKDEHAHRRPCCGHASGEKRKLEFMHEASVDFWKRDIGRNDAARAKMKQYIRVEYPRVYRKILKKEFLTENGTIVLGTEGNEWDWVDLMPRVIEYFESTLTGLTLEKYKTKVWEKITGVPKELKKDETAMKTFFEKVLLHSEPAAPIG